ncbi:hypothetical protein GCM10023093_04580 [Nemorincola caseinilytica]|uniref:Uncharacterized protein n=1 Tax=Nemorincola caseinilytica TaxID=2054315 RepID=A0ABP8N877_9BACT
MKKIAGLLVFAGIIAAAGCIKKKDFDFKNLTIDNWQPDWALPLIYSDLTLKNIVQTGTTISENSEGTYSLHYSGDLFSARASDYIRIQDQSYATSGITLSIPQNLPSFSGSFSDSTSGNFSFADDNGSQLAHVNVKSGSITLNVTSTFRHNVNAVLTFPTVKNNGMPLQVTVAIGYPATSNATTISLAGYSFDLTNGGTAKNYLPYKVRFTLSGTGQSISGTDNLSASISIKDIQYSFIDGFLGSYDIPIPADTIYVGVFDNTLSANIYIRNPMIHLSFHNSIGLGVAAKFDQLFGRTNKGTNVNMLLPDIAVPGAIVPGETATKTHTIDSNNSSVQNMFNPAPNEVIYAGRVRINPGGTGTTTSFVTDSSRVSLVAEAELPAWFRIINFALQDTVKLTLPEDSSLVRTAQFKMLMDNALPLYGAVQVYFADENYNFVDSLVPTTNDIIGEAPVDANGKVTGRKQAVTTFEMTHDEYNAMAPKVRYAVLRGRLKTSGAGDVKIQSSNNLIVKLAFRFTLNVSSTDIKN